MWCCMFVLVESENRLLRVFRSVEGETATKPDTEQIKHGIL